MGHLVKFSFPFVQKEFKGKMVDEINMGLNRFKYPRTPHLPWSPGKGDEDDVLQNTEHLLGKEIVVTEKLDGENTTMYSDYIHARSIDSRAHLSRDWIKNFHSAIAYHIPQGWRFCGENLYAKHSIAYSHLESYFYLFSIWDDQNLCRDWLQTIEWAQLLNLKMPTELYRGVWDERLISNLTIDAGSCEGYVVRTVESFSYDAFIQHVAKWVRKGHVTTDAQWMEREVVPNRLRA